jgi:hypothetical protein
VNYVLTDLNYGSHKRGLTDAYGRLLATAYYHASDVCHEVRVRT